MTERAKRGVPRIFVVLPAYNEEGAIEPLLENILAVTEWSGLEINTIVVDDGSQDKTADGVRTYASRGVVLVQHPANRGLHEAVRTGLLHVLSTASDDDAIVTLDADNTHHPQLIPPMIDRLESGADLVIASRFAPGGRMVGAPFIRHVYSVGARLVLRSRFPMKGVRDYTCGYRAYRVDVLRAAFERWGAEFMNVPGFSCMLDILLRLRTMGVTAVEVPLVLRYDLKVSPSKLRVVKTIRNTLGLVASSDRK
jgi:dolichol-phosphate mannosyltransferase